MLRSGKFPIGSQWFAIVYDIIGVILGGGFEMNKVSASAKKFRYPFETTNNTQHVGAVDFKSFGRKHICEKLNLFRAHYPGIAVISTWSIAAKCFISRI